MRIRDVVKAIVTIGLVGTCAWIWIAGGAPAPELSAMAGICIGSYFGRKADGES